MSKVKIGTSVVCLFILCLFFNNLLVLMNYLLALFLHELAHLIVATKRGYELKMFRIDLFGMSIDIDSDIASKDCFAVNVAGPMMNLCLYLICVMVGSFYPHLYIYLHTFALANLSLALFNLLPIYPLDGGKIFRGLVSSENTFLKIDKWLRNILGIIFLGLFICSFANTINWFCLLFVIFLVQTHPKKSLFYRKEIKNITLHRLDVDVDLYTSIQLLDKDKYGVFYIDGRCIAEDRIYELALRYPLNSKLKDIN